MNHKTGLILEGGAMRGMFTCGVLDVFMENGLTFDGAVGVSAGACFGCNIKSKQIGRAIRYNLQFCNDKRYGSMRSLIRSGDYYNADFCYRYVPEEVDIFDRKTFYENPMEFHIVTTDIESGEPLYYNCEKDDPRLLDWIRASASLPFFARIVEIDGKKLMDGGIADSIPLRYFESIGYDRNIVILTQPRGYIKKKTSMMTAIRIKYRKYQSPIMSMSKVIKMAAALVSMLALETAMFSQFGGEMSAGDKQIFVALSGAGVSIAVIAMSVYMIVRSTREIKERKKDGRE